MRRVAVIGCGGAGKSTLARTLGRRLDLPVVHLDEHHWRPGWRRIEPAAWRQTQMRLVAADEWILDGNYLATLELRLRAADTVVFLDLPRRRCAWRATRRVLAGRGRANTAAGCAERLDRRHLAFLRYIWGFAAGPRSRVLRLLAAHRDSTTIVRLTPPAEVRRFLAGPAPAAGAGRRRQALRRPTERA